MYNVTDLTELVRHHLVLSIDDTEVADQNLAQLMRNIEQMVTTPRWHEPIYWMVCEECGAWVSSELFGPDGACECEDSGFRCTDCRFADKEPRPESSSVRLQRRSAPGAIVQPGRNSSGGWHE